MDEIKFYKTEGPYGFLSNFSPSYIFINGKVWPTVEHYFQACKFHDEVIINKIKNQISPMRAAMEGRNVNNKLRSDWDIMKDSYMLQALNLKFFQNPELRTKLLLTGKSILIEDTANDNYWGNGGDGSGKNRLGLLLMEVRKTLAEISDDVNLILPPWIAFPDVSSYDLFWRMGIGEDYLTKWNQCFEISDKNIYINKFPPTEDWQHFYEED